jgi:hypothetical protein
VLVRYRTRRPETRNPGDTGGLVVTVLRGFLSCEYKIVVTHDAKIYTGPDPGTAVLAEG